MGDIERDLEVTSTLLKVEKKGSGLKPQLCAGKHLVVVYDVCYNRADLFKSGKVGPKTVLGFSLHFRLAQYCFKLLSLSTLNRSLGCLLISSSLGDFPKAVGVALWVCKNLSNFVCKLSCIPTQCILEFSHIHVAFR